MRDRTQELVAPPLRSTSRMYIDNANNTYDNVSSSSTFPTSGQQATGTRAGKKFLKYMTKNPFHGRAPEDDTHAIQMLTLRNNDRYSSDRAPSTLGSPPPKASPLLQGSAASPTPSQRTTAPPPYSSLAYMSPASSDASIASTSFLPSSQYLYPPQQQNQRRENSSSNASAAAMNATAAAFHVGPDSTSHLFSSSSSIPTQDVFFKQVADIRTKISSLKDNVKSLEQLHDQVLNHTQMGGLATPHKQLDALNAETTQLREQISRCLKVMDQQINGAKTSVESSAASEESVPRLFSSQVRARVVQYLAICKSFKEAITELQSMEIKSREKHKSILHRQYRIVNPGATDEDIESFFAASDLEGGQPGNAFAQQQSLIFSSQFTTGKRSTYNSQKTLDAVADRNRDMQLLTRSILELQSLFQELSDVIHLQGESLDSIEDHVIHAEADLERGTIQMKQAVRKQRSRRRCMMITTVTTVILLILGGLALFLFLKFFLK